MPPRDPGHEAPDHYLTDGTRLFRIVTILGRPPHGGLIEIEDCRSLEVVLMRVEDIRGLRHVALRTRPAAVASSR